MAYEGKDYDSIRDPQEIEFNKIKTETEKSWLLELDDREEWFPKSECGMDKEPDERSGTVYVPLWIAEKKGIA